ncbi:MAG: permease prefix domain 1-containing protein [Planctomycetota bacterium]
MPEAEFETYLAAMAKLLRLSPKQRDAIAGELRDHLESRLAELQELGVERDEAVRRALDEFGDMAVLSDDLARPQRDLKRRRLMQTSFATAALAAIAVLITTSLLPSSNPASVPPANADKAEASEAAAAGGIGEVVAEGGVSVKQTPGQADGVVIEADRVTVKGVPATATAVPERKGGFVYVLGQTRRPGAYTVPADGALTLPQLLASMGGLPEGVDGEGLVVEVVRALREFKPAKATIRVRYPDAIRATGLYLAPNDLVQIKPASEPALEYEPEVLIVDMNTIVPFLIDEPERANEMIHSDWWRDRQMELAQHVSGVLIGLGYEDRVRSVDVWMGVLTITGSPEALAAAERYLDQMRETLKRRSADKREASRLPIDAVLEPIDREIAGLERSARALNDALMQLGGPFQEDHPTTQRIRARVDEIRKRVAALHERRAELILQATDGARVGAARDELLRRMMEWEFKNRKSGYEMPRPAWWPAGGYSGFGLTRPAE